MKWIKRLLLGIILVFVLAVMVLWILSYRPGHGTFEVSAFIDRPTAVVFGALVDDDMTKRWVSGIDNIKELTPRPAHVGTKIIITERINGHMVVMEEEITELKPPFIKKYTSKGIGDPSTSFMEYGEYQLEPKDGGTLFTMKSQLEFHGFLYRLLEPLMTPMARSKFEGDQKKLKAILEAAPKVT
jgi:uncharacterized protein YndB with AHSA1/START domain